MKPQLLKVASGPTHSFSARQDLLPDINSKWHYHPEVELIHFERGEGTQFIGDSIKRFKSGDIVLVGANLPHYWRFDECYFNKEAAADIRVVHFNENFWGEAFWTLPENKVLKSLLEKGRRGIKVSEGNSDKIAGCIKSMLHSEGPERIMFLIQALLEISKSDELEILSSVGFKYNFEEKENDKINDIYNYSLANSTRKISLEEIAAVAKISPHSFCRYFKSRTRKTYSSFLNEVRVGQACRLLIENRLNIKQICFESGFNNFASFHKWFKSITGKSPLTYQKEYFIEKPVDSL